jgi:uncharacterized repeat protein (TIGR01451 family)
MKLVRSLLVATLAVALVSPRFALAQGQGAQALVITAHNVTAEAAADRGAKAIAKPGDEIRYSLVFTNVTKASVKNVQFVDPIPSGMVYVLGSAAADQPVRLEYSIDGGKSYSAQPVVLKVEDGKKVEQPAPRELYTHVRWTVLASVAPGAKVSAELRTQVSAGPGEAK